MERIPSASNSCHHLLIGLGSGEVDDGGRLPALGGMGPLVVVEGHSAPDARTELRPGFPSVQADAFILQRQPEA